MVLLGLSACSGTSVLGSGEGLGKIDGATTADGGTEKKVTRQLDTGDSGIVDLPARPQIGGGNSTSKTDSGTAVEAVPSPSPDSDALAAWLAFDKQPKGATRGVYLVNSNPTVQGCVSRLTDSAANAKQPAFSDDGKFIAYASEVTGTYQIHLLDLKTGENTPLTDLPQGATYPTFSPSGLTIAFVTGDPEAVRDGTTETPPGTGDVMLLNVKTGATQLLKVADPQVNFPYFAPAFASKARLLVSNGYAISALALNFSADPITISNERVLTSSGVPQEPAPSPNGLEMAYPDTCADTLQLEKLDIDLGSTRNCTPASRDFRRDEGILAPDWGSWGFIAVEFAGPLHGIFLVFDDATLSGGGGVAGAEGGRNPDWAPPDFRWACSPAGL
ncbi:MAG: hypothetical protein RJA70_4627 [Pseudomonadota bacterium]|jgi:hypothetical protein